MIAKKNNKANLERKRFAFFQIGLLVSGSLCLAAFEWSTAVIDERVEILQDDIRIIGTDIPDDIDKFKIVKEQQTKKLVNLDNLDDIKVVKKLLVQGNIQTTNNNDVIFIPGDDCVDCEVDMTLYDEDSGKIWPITEIDPQFPGGPKAMSEWLGNQIEYPAWLAEMGIGGVVYIQFVINVDGSIVQVKSTGGPHIDLEKEGRRVVSKMPKWSPGEQAGKPVRVRFTLPINFVNS